MQRDTTKPLYFPIVPMKIGNMLLDATARAEGVTDQVERKLLVKVILAALHSRLLLR